MFANKKLLFWLVLLIIVATASCVIYFLHTDKYIYKQGNSTEADIAVSAALKVYKDQVGKIDFSNGPCLTNDLIPNWVADIVHNPREVVDNLPENQCPAYLEGRAKHFVELDPNGNIIRVK